MKSTALKYGRVAQLFHWLSALLIVVLIPMGFWMQSAEPAVKPLLYKTHVLIGLSVLGITVLRLVWRWLDTTPDLPAGLEGRQRLAYQGIHWLLYLVLLVMAASGIALNLTSGLSDVLFAGAPGPIPANLAEFPARAAHGLLVRIFIGLLVAHLVGVVSYQVTHGDVLSRMGLAGMGLAHPEQKK